MSCNNMADIVARKIKVASLEKIIDEENIAIHREIKANIAWNLCGLDFVHVLFSPIGVRSY